MSVKGREPKKTTAKKGHLSEKLIKHYHSILLATQQKITQDVMQIENEQLSSHKDSSGDLSGYSLHMADVGTDNYEQELALDVVGNEQDILYEINNALNRIENKTFGVCELYGTPIPKTRLDAIPWTPYCKEAAEEIENARRKR